MVIAGLLSGEVDANAWQFSADYGPHSDYTTESWYFTGAVTNQDRQSFGFQLSFFRLRLAQEQDADRQPHSAWRTDEMFRAQLTLTDVANEQFHAFEAASRAALGLSGAQTDPLRIWVYDWTLQAVDESKAGDPQAGYQALLNKAYVTCGMPYQAYRQMSEPPAESHRILDRNGLNGELPYMLTAHTNEEGVQLVTSNCLTCHGAFFNGPETRRRIYDTALLGYSNQGHTFGDVLSEEERRAVLEYLKTL